MDKSPDAFRTISEVAEHLETPAHVLRFWESRFPQIRPVKRAGGRRYYRPSDVALLVGIKRLLHDEGMTIRGVQKILREQGVRHVSGMPDDVVADVNHVLHEESAIPRQAEVLNFGVTPGLAAATAKALDHGPSAEGKPAAPSLALPPLEPAQGALWLTLAPQLDLVDAQMRAGRDDVDVDPDGSPVAPHDHVEFIASATIATDGMGKADSDRTSFGDDFDDDFDGGPIPTLASRIRALPPEASAANVAADLVAIVVRLKSLRDDMASAAHTDEA